MCSNLLASGVGVLFHFGVLLVRGREERLSSLFELLPSKICDSCEWLVTEFG